MLSLDIFIFDMSNTIDRIFNDVCLDERISDGIFRMDEEQHMNALRDYFAKRGLTKEAVVSITNRMTEGKYPDRQAYRTEDGILVTWPSRKHMEKAMKENPGKYTDKNPFPKETEKPEVEQNPKSDPATKEPPKDSLPTDQNKNDDSPPKQNIFPTNTPVVSGDGKQLNVEPVVKQTSNVPAPSNPPQPVAQQKTPERVSAEKEVVKQIFGTDDTALTDVSSPVYINEACREELAELYKKASEMGYKNAITFLTPYVTS